ncbi:hypothetical protein L596_024096 [Steinernema carpocapsae]|uniref:Large ribosomal subunit protein uL3m n=1 Tax=Steinernema carpocapsae TaxID=34508 RepID=A0A4U5MFP0_STECR|nr:hypothetical protein L596_024096 [Steinernema carpocapsae]
MLRAVTSALSSPLGAELLSTPVCSTLATHHLNQTRGRRRTLTKPPWIPKKYDSKNSLEFLDEENRALLDQVTAQEKAGVRSLARSPVPLVQNYSWEEREPQEWSPSSRRVGLLGRKIGMMPQWLNDGTRVLCTLLEITENQVVSSVDPETWYRTSIVGKHKAFHMNGPMWKVTVGAVNANPKLLTANYRNMFERQNIPAKQKLGSFLVTEDAVVAPGTKLDVRHFLPGQFVTVSGKTIDWGFQGGMHRWGMRGMPTRNTTKSHRRIGSVGSTGDARIWPGKRMPGHMGYEWITLSGLKVLRINPEYQVIYVKGNVPGEVGDFVHIKDCVQELKRVRNPPFPTYYPELETISEEAEAAAAQESSEIYVPELFRFNSPSVVFSTEEKKSKGRDRTKAKIAKVKK